MTMEPQIRGETWQLAFGPEFDYGTDPTTSYIKTAFGVVQTMNAPDPDMEYQPIWALGSASKRNFYIVYKGKLTLAGSVPDIWLLNGAPLFLPIGTVATVGSTKSGCNTTLTGAHAAGVTSLTVGDSTGAATGDIVQIGTVTGAECVRVASVPNSTHITLAYPLRFAHSGGEAVVEKQTPYTHTISEASVLKSISLQHEMFNAEGTSKLIRRWLGGKCGRATYSGAEGEELRMNIEELLFRDYKKTGDSGIATAPPTYPRTEPYIFSYGSLTLWGTEFARLRNWTIEVVNELEPKYYVTNDATPRLPYEFKEGKRTYRVAVTIDIVDSTLFDELIKFGVNQGVASDGIFKGFDISIAYTRGTNDSITFTLPPSAAAGGGDAQGCFIRTAPHNIVTEPGVSVPLDILARSMKIVAVDDVPNWFDLVVV
jgi:hypothetical protein